MNERFKGYLDFTVKSFIFLFALYFLMHAFCLADLKRMIGLMEEIDRKTAQLSTHASQIDQQVRAMNSRNPEFIFHAGLMSEQNGDRNTAARTISLAIQMSQQNIARYNQELVRLMQQGAKP